MPDHQPNTAILILAAGASTRLGSPKQLVKIGDKYLLEKMVETALATAFRPVIVVLGAHFEKIKKSIAHLPVEMLENENWESGMGSTIACGMTHLLQKHPAVSGVILVLTDQPFVTPDILQKLPHEAKRQNRLIAAAQYDGTLGPPAFFGKKLFAELRKLDGKSGAKKLLAQHRENLTVVDFPAGNFDLDTPEDVRKFRQHSQG